MRRFVDLLRSWLWFPCSVPSVEQDSYVRLRTDEQIPRADSVQSAIGIRGEGTMMAEVNAAVSDSDLPSGVPFASVEDEARSLWHARREAAVLLHHGNLLQAVGALCTHDSAPLVDRLQWTPTQGHEIDMRRRRTWELTS